MVTLNRDESNDICARKLMTVSKKSNHQTEMFIFYLHLNSANILVPLGKTYHQGSLDKGCRSGKIYSSIYPFAFKDINVAIVNSDLQNLDGNSSNNPELLKMSAQKLSTVTSKITKFMGPTWDPPGSCRPQMGPMLAPWTLLSGLSPSCYWRIVPECWWRAFLWCLFLGY